MLRFVGFCLFFVESSVEVNKHQKSKFPQSHKLFDVDMNELLVVKFMASPNLSFSKTFHLRERLLLWLLNV